jgi:hypothetical protein
MLMNDKPASPWTAKNVLLYADHVTPSNGKSWQKIRQQAAVARTLYFARGLRPRSFLCIKRYVILPKRALSYLHHFFIFRKHILEM